MNYENAKEILPSELFQQLQKYAGGKLLYVPKEESQELAWGEGSGYRTYLAKRNRLMVNKFLFGVSIQQLAMEYNLSGETVKKIVYSKKQQGTLPFHAGFFSAWEYEQSGFLEEWIHTYLLFFRKNSAFSEGLLLEKRYYLGPMMMNPQLFTRSSGPEPDMKWRVDEGHFERGVAKWLDKIQREQWEEISPIIIGYTDGVFEINCGSPVFEAMNRAGMREIPVIIWTTATSDYEDFREKYENELVKPVRYVCQV